MMKRTLALACITLGSAWTLHAQAVDQPTAGMAAPEVTATDENGTAHELSSYKGNIVVLEWTNPDCPYVQRHYRSETMEKLEASFPDEKVTWLAVNSTGYNTPADTRRWREAHGFSYATLQDAAGDVGHAFGARTTPHMFVLDTEGVVRYSGAIDDDPRGSSDAPRNYVGEAVNALLEGKAPEVTSTRAYGCSVKYVRR